MSKVLKPEFVSLIINDAELQGKIASLNNKSPQSALRWARKNNQKRLTMFGTLQAISAHTGKKIDSLTKSVKVAQ
jgi:hypothetical protein